MPTPEPQHENPPRKLTPFDPDLSPDSAVNRRAAKERGLRFSNGYYVDAEGSLVLDKFGQPVG